MESLISICVKLLILITTLENSFCLLYLKNKDIAIKQKIYSKEPRIIDLSPDSKQSLDHKKKEIEESQNLVILIFVRENCDICTQQIKILSKISTYEISSNVSFYTVNCSEGELNDYFMESNIRTFPTTVIQYRRNKIKYLIDFTAETLLELIDKLADDEIKELKSNKQIREKSRYFGDVSFLMIYDRQIAHEASLFTCYRELSQTPEFSEVYFFQMSSKVFRRYSNDYDIVPPGIKVLGQAAEKTNMHLQLRHSEGGNTCEDIKVYLSENRFPIIKKATSEYLEQVRAWRKVLVLVALDTKDIEQVAFLEGTVHSLSLSFRSFVFAYLDVNIPAELQMLNFFHIGNPPSLVLYDFSRGMHHIIDNTDLSDLPKLLEHKLMSFQDLELSSGYWLEDFLRNKFNIKVNRLFLLACIMFILMCILGTCLVYICKFVDRIARPNVPEYKKRV